MMRRGGAVEFVITTVLGLAVVVLATIALFRHDVRVDFTEGQRRTLKPETRAVLDLLERPVELIAFYQDIPQDRQRLRELVERYQETSPYLRLEFVDLDRRPDLADTYGITANGTVLLVDGDLRVRTIDPDEAELTNALLRLVRSDPPVIMFVTGHGESSLEDEGPAGWTGVVDVLADQNFELRILSTAAVERIPPETDLVVVAGPQSDLSSYERSVLIDHVLRGGSLLAMLEPFGSASFDSLIARFGVVAEPGFVVDASPEQRNVTNGGDQRIVLAIGGDREHPVTRGFSYNTLYPLARGLSSVQPPPPGIRLARLVESEPQAWIESDPAQFARGEPRFDPRVDRPGPVALGFAVEIDLREFDLLDDDDLAGVDRTLLELWGGFVDVRDSARVDTLRVGDLDVRTQLAEGARMIVFGDADFASNANLRVQGNGELLLASVLWLTEQEDRIALTEGPDLDDPVVLEANQLAAVRWIGVVGVPLAFFAIAAVTLWRRRQWV